MLVKDYLATLYHIVNECPTVYCNKPGKNLGYYDGSTGLFSFDCWNLIKAILNGWQDIRVNGYRVKSLPVTGDLTGAQMLNKCTVKSKDFSKLSTPGAYLYISTSPHAGTYIGEHIINGKYYNVVECTGSWDKKVLYSWVDADGTRRRYKGGSKSSRWTDWGLMCWVDYTDVTPNPTPTVVPTDDENKVVLGKYYYKSTVDKQMVDMGYVFNASYYRKHNADVVKVYGSGDMQLFQHFKDHGMKEERQGIPSFNVKKYKEDSIANHKSDLIIAYGTKPEDNPKYYEHYCRFGRNEPRNAK